MHKILKPGKANKTIYRQQSACFLGGWGFHFDTDMTMGYASKIIFKNAKLNWKHDSLSKLVYKYDTFLENATY